MGVISIKNRATLNAKWQNQAAGGSAGRLNGELTGTVAWRRGQAVLTLGIPGRQIHG
jgi:hypothetical protein